jgi:hypothetical protein
VNASLTLIMLATGGTAALVGAAFLFGFNRSAGIADEAAAKHFLYLYAQDVVADTVVLSSDQANALIVSDDKRVFLVAMVGDSPVTRELKMSDILPYAKGEVHIDVRDFGFPPRSFRVENHAIQPIFEALNQGAIQ